MDLTSKDDNTFKKEISNEKVIHNHYPGLDGLRAIAVIMVFFQHYGNGKAFIFGWGWTGVDIFFVLSGFLITGILFDSRHQANKYLNFYMRRTLRIFPLYYFLWALFLILSPFVHWEWDWRWATWPGYFGNYARFIFLNHAENVYQFDRLTFGANVTKWFGFPVHLYIGHFWSLCVEEQFYLIWPLLIYKIGNRKSLIKICTVVIITMPFIRWLIVATASSKLLELELLYRSMPTRIDALLIGGLLALLIRGPQKELLFRLRHWMIFGGLFLLIITYLTITNLLKVPYTGSATNWISIFGFTLIDICAAGVLLETIKANGLLEKILSIKLLRNFGIITYGFYVYHDLLHDFYAYFANRFFPENAFPATLIIAFSCTWIIAVLSFWIIEMPMLKFKAYFSNQLHKAPTSETD